MPSCALRSRRSGQVCAARSQTQNEWRNSPLSLPGDRRTKAKMVGQQMVWMLWENEFLSVFDALFVFMVYCVGIWESDIVQIIITHNTETERP